MENKQADMDHFYEMEPGEIHTLHDEPAAEMDENHQSIASAEEHARLAHESAVHQALNVDWTTSIILEAGETKEQYRVHVHVLKKDSSYFRELLSSEWDTAGNGIISMPDVSPSALSFYIDLLYSGRRRLNKTKVKSIREQYELDGIIFLMQVYSFAKSIADDSMCDLLATAIVDVFSLIKKEHQGHVWDIDQSIIDHAYNAQERMPLLTRILVSVCSNMFRHLEWLDGTHPDFIKDLAIAAVHKKYTLIYHGDICQMHLHTDLADRHCRYAGHPYGISKKAKPKPRAALNPPLPAVPTPALSNPVPSAQVQPEKKRKLED